MYAVRVPPPELPALQPMALQPMPVATALPSPLPDAIVAGPPPVFPAASAQAPQPEQRLPDAEDDDRNDESGPAGSGGRTTEVAYTISFSFTTQ